MPKTKEEEKSDKRVDKLLEALEAEKAEKAELRKELDDKEEVERKEKDPMSGPGELCEVTKITLSESWQLKSREVINPKTQTEEMVTEPAPEGYIKRIGPNNSYFVVKKGNETVVDPTTKKPIHLADVVIPNCRSKYTLERSVFDKKPIRDRGDFKKDPPRYNIHLCEKHSKMFGAQKPVKNSSK